MASIRKRTWRHRGVIKTAWVVDYRDQAGRRRLKTFQAKKAADAWLVDARGEVARGSHVHDRDTITVAEAVDLWLEVCENFGRRGREPVEPHTLRAYKTHGNHIKGLIGATKLNRLTGPKCIEFRDELLKRLSRKNAAKVLTSFKSALREMWSRGLLSTDPAEDVSIVDSSRRRERLVVSDEDRVGHIPSPDQLGRILAAADLLAKANDQRTAIAWLRMSELRCFPWVTTKPAGSR